MTEQQNKIVGNVIFALCLLVALYWCVTSSGLFVFFLDLGAQLTGTNLIQISWLLCFVVLGIPGLMAKRYFEAKAWEAHLAALPKANARESAKRSKYVKTDNLPPQPQVAVDLTSLPEGQEEFIATCSSCEHLFSAKKGVKDLKCPSCGEPIPVNS